MPDVTVKFEKTFDDDARRRFEEWARMTGRHGRIMWSTVKVDQSRIDRTVITFHLRA